MAQALAQREDDLQDQQSIVEHLQEQLQAREREILALIAEANNQEQTVWSAQVCRCTVLRMEGQANSLEADEGVFFSWNDGFFLFPVSRAKFC